MTESDSNGHGANILRPGTRAPDFALNATPDQVLRLSELRGRPVILVFYPADWSPVCGDQVALYNEILPEFRVPRGGRHERACALRARRRRNHSLELLLAGRREPWCRRHPGGSRIPRWQITASQS